jgi:hypothetical protein
MKQGDGLTSGKLGLKNKTNLLIEEYKLWLGGLTLAGPKGSGFSPTGPP